MVKIGDLHSGVQMCLENVQKLIEDAELLFEHKSYGRATSLALIGIEEIAKALVLSEAYFSNRELESKDDVFRYHRVKNAVLIGAIAAMHTPVRTTGTKAENKAITATEIQEFVAKVEKPLMRVLEEVDDLRKAGLYVDYKKEKWCSPVDIVHEEARFHVELARRLLAELSPKCKVFIEHASIRPQLYTAVRAMAKESLDRGEISVEFYNNLLSALED